jgi:hypothetical protein
LALGSASDLEPASDSVLESALVQASESASVLEWVSASAWVPGLASASELVSALPEAADYRMSAADWKIHHRLHHRTL